MSVCRVNQLESKELFLFHRFHYDCDEYVGNTVNNCSREAEKLTPCFTALVQSCAVRGGHDHPHDRNNTSGTP